MKDELKCVYIQSFMRLADYIYLYLVHTSIIIIIIIIITAQARHIQYSLCHATPLYVRAANRKLNVFEAKEQIHSWGKYYMYSL